MKSFGEIIQNQLLFEGFGIMKTSRDWNLKMADSEFQIAQKLPLRLLR